MATSRRLPARNLSDVVAVAGRRVALEVQQPRAAEQLVAELAVAVVRELALERRGHEAEPAGLVDFGGRRRAREVGQVPARAVEEGPRVPVRDEARAPESGLVAAREHVRRPDGPLPVVRGLERDVARLADAERGREGRGAALEGVALHRRAQQVGEPRGEGPRPARAERPLERVVVVAHEQRRGRREDREEASGDAPLVALRRDLEAPHGLPVRDLVGVRDDDDVRRLEAQRGAEGPQRLEDAVPRGLAAVVEVAVVLAGPGGPRPDREVEHGRGARDRPVGRDVAPELRARAGHAVVEAVRLDEHVRVDDARELRGPRAHHVPLVEHVERVDDLGAGARDVLAARDVRRVRDAQYPADVVVVRRGAVALEARQRHGARARLRERDVRGGFAGHGRVVAGREVGGDPVLVRQLRQELAVLVEEAVGLVVVELQADGREIRDHDVVGGADDGDVGRLGVAQQQQQRGGRAHHGVVLRHQRPIYGRRSARHESRLPIPIRPDASAT